MDSIAKSPERLEIIKKIKEYESKGYFDKDVEDDPPTRPLKPGECDYTGKKLSSRLMTKISNFIGRNYINSLIKKKVLIIKEIRGLSYYEKVQGGAFITCNHFNPMDNFAVYKAIEPYLNKEKRCLYKIIREGNYTSFKGFYGFLFRHCNTLPLASGLTVMKEFLSGLTALLGRGEKVLIYPEQGMWWNYRKPRPLKDGAFNLAAKNGVPVLPIFITLSDSEIIGEDGFNVQEYTLNFLPPIYPDKDKSVKENTKEMKEKNYDAWVAVYEEFYGKKLSYEEE